jgi:long-subunit acyl-CoA synthetase (AMP-forming)
LVNFGKNAGLMSYEQVIYFAFNINFVQTCLIEYHVFKVKVIHLHPKLMSLENGLATPTMKIKRQEVRKYFQTTIAEMYNEKLESKSRL